MREEDKKDEGPRLRNVFLAGTVVYAVFLTIILGVTKYQAIKNPENYDIIFSFWELLIIIPISSSIGGAFTCLLFATGINKLY